MLNKRLQLRICLIRLTFPERFTFAEILIHLASLKILVSSGKAHTCYLTDSSAPLPQRVLKHVPYSML